MTKSEISVFKTAMKKQLRIKVMHKFRSTGTGRIECVVDAGSHEFIGIGSDHDSALDEAYEMAASNFTGFIEI